MEGDTADGLQVQPGRGTAQNVSGILWISSLMCDCVRAGCKRVLKRGGVDPERGWPNLMSIKTGQICVSQQIRIVPLLL